MKVSGGKRVALLLAAGLSLAAVLAICLVLSLRPRKAEVLSPPPSILYPLSSISDPRRTYAGPYRNIDPDVRYVGDAACAGCHKDIAESYARHPMGRSLVAAA